MYVKKEREGERQIGRKKGSRNSLPDKLFAKRKGCQMHLKLHRSEYKVEPTSLNLASTDAVC